MPKFANAHLVLNSRDRTLTGSSGVYNNFRVSNAGQNIVQGEMKDIALSEVLFPYDIPNVQAGYNTFRIVSGAGVGIDVTVPPGFYTPLELVAAWNAAVVAAGAALPPGDGGPIAPTDLPTVSYTISSNQFALNGCSNAAGPDWDVFSPYTFPFGVYLGSELQALGKDIFSIMGFERATSIAGIPTLTSGDLAVVVGGSAPLLFTQYIDICSPKLCQNQFIRDGNTTTLARRPDLLCRLYIADENSGAVILDPATVELFIYGTRPFVIHRQFQNQRVMRWTAANSIAEIDIQLYDDCGIPLTTSWTPRNFQLTFHVYEAEDGVANANIGYRY